MTSDQERALFEQYGWQYDHIGRKWVAPDDTWITTDQIMEATADSAGDLVLMALIVEHGKREAPH